MYAKHVYRVHYFLKRSFPTSCWEGEEKWSNFSIFTEKGGVKLGTKLPDVMRSGYEKSFITVVEWAVMGQSGGGAEVGKIMQHRQGWLWPLSTFGSYWFHSPLNTQHMGDSTNNCWTMEQTANRWVNSKQAN